MGQRPDGAREPPAGSSGNRCSGNASCPGRGGRAGEVALSCHTVRQPVQLGGSHSSGHGSAGLGWTRPQRPRARPLQSQNCSLGWARCGELGSVHPAGCWQEAGEHLYLAKPLPIFLPGVVPMNGPPVANAQPCLRTSPQTWNLLRLLHPCSCDRGKLHLPGGHLQPKRGIVMLVLGRP